MNSRIESGFSMIIIAIIIFVAIAGAGGTIFYTRLKAAQDEKAFLATQKQIKADADAKAAALKEKSTQAIADAPAATPAPAPAPTPAPQPAKQAAPAPAQSTSNATAFTNDNCPYKNITAYASNKNGTAVSSNTPNQWQTVKTYAYGSTISGLCDVWNYEYPDYVNISGVFVKKADLSPTKP